MEAERQATPQRCFLLGAMDKAQPLDVNDQRNISETVSVSVNDVAEAALVSKKCFMADIGFEGTVFSSGDTLIITAHRQEFVMKVDTFLSVRVSGSCRLLGKGCCYAFSLTNDGQPIRDFWSGFVKVQNRPLTDPVFFQIEDTARKVILYNCGNSLFTVVDYQRQLQGLPYTIVVPVYPKNGDMLLIQGEQINDIWCGHVHSVDYTQKTVDVFFFVKRNTSQNVFVREATGRYARNVVPWDSIIGVAEGHWLSPSQWHKQP